MWKYWSNDYWYNEQTGDSLFLERPFSDTWRACLATRTGLVLNKDFPNEDDAYEFARKFMGVDDE